MDLRPEQNLLHYRLIEQIGQGGMGVVWRAVDTTLDREVAIKVLPQGFAEDAERLARFEREAKVLGSLAHPNIAPIYGLHESDGSRFLAMELVPGDDLSVRLAAGRLPVDDSLEIAGQIADALEAAHENGIVHRDLKPANVRIGPDGRVRVLDFGLAKTVEAGPASGHSPTLSPTVTSAGSVAGMIMGTAAFMSPEQARGKPVDRQTDVWSFGCVLFEMLAGRPAYSGETVTDVLTAILHRDPDWDALPALSPGVDRVLRGCLQKEQRARFRDIGDVGLMLRETATDSATDASPVKTSGASPWRALAVVSTLALAVLAALIAIGPLRPGGGTEATASPIIKSIVQLTDIPGTQSSPSLSGDAEQLLFVAEDGGDTDIFLQRVGGENPINLTEDYADDDFQPEFSPDRKSIAFASRREGGGIFVMGATGESPQQISDTGFDPTWSPDGRKIVYTTERVKDAYNRIGNAVLWMVDLDSSERTQLNDIDAAGASWSPNGHRIAFWTHYATVEGQRDIWTMAADGSDPVPVIEDVATDWDPFWSPDGRLLYFISDRGGRPDLWRVPIDERNGHVRGEIEPVTSGPSYVSSASISADGHSIAINFVRATGMIVRMAFDPVQERVAGPPETVLTSSNPVVQMDVSRDGEWIAYRTTAPRETLYVMRTDGTSRRKILDDEHRNRGPVWSPDGSWLAFYSNRNDGYQEWALRPNGTGLRQLTKHDGVGTSGPAWTADGKQILIWRSDPTDTALLTLELPPDGIDGVTEPLAAQAIPTTFGISALSLSPDGRVMAGPSLDPQGELALGVYVFESGEYRVLARDDGRVFRGGIDVVGWIDDHRFVFWDYELRSAVIWDLARSESRLLPDIPGPGELSFRDGGKTLYLNRFPVESDIWMLTLH